MNSKNLQIITSEHKLVDPMVMQAQKEDTPFIISLRSIKVEQAHPPPSPAGEPKFNLIEEDSNIFVLKGLRKEIEEEEKLNN